MEIMSRINFVMIHFAPTASIQAIGFGGQRIATDLKLGLDKRMTEQFHFVELKRLPNSFHTFYEILHRHRIGIDGT